MYYVPNELQFVGGPKSHSEVKKEFQTQLIKHEMRFHKDLDPFVIVI